MNFIIGISMLILLFGGVLFWAFLEVGWKGALKAIGLTFGAIIWILIAAYLMENSS